MPIRMPICTLPTVLALCVLGYVVAIAAASATWEVSVPLDGLTAAGRVALDRLLHGDLGGALEAFAAVLQG